MMRVPSEPSLSNGEVKRHNASPAGEALRSARIVVAPLAQTKQRLERAEPGRESSERQEPIEHATPPEVFAARADRALGQGRVETHAAVEAEPPPKGEPRVDREWNADVSELSLELSRSAGVADAAPRGARSEAIPRIDDPEGFAAIVAEHQPALVGYLMRMTRCPDRAQELAQEAFVRLFLSRQHYQEQGLLLAYLFRIATNLLRSQERRKSRWRRLEPVYQAGLEMRTESPHREIERGEASQRVSAAIAELPLKFRAPLVLREIEGWTYCEIAAALECREGTVKSRVNRAKQRLRRRLEAFWRTEVRP